MDVADETRLVLLVLRLRGAADPATVADVLEAMGVVVDDPATLLDRLELAGLVERGTTGSARRRLTGDGRREGERLLAVELDERGARGRITAAYTDFLAGNGPLLRVCTDWQLRDANPAAIIVNDHRDADFDRQVLERLGEVQRRVLPVCHELMAALARFGRYGPRLTRAFDRFIAGDAAALDGPSPDSYHGTWFELHENLIATLGRDRATEPLPDVS